MKIFFAKQNFFIQLMIQTDVLGSSLSLLHFLIEKAVFHIVWIYFQEKSTDPPEIQMQKRTFFIQSKINFLSNRDIIKVLISWIIDENQNKLCESKFVIYKIRNWFVMLYVDSQNRKIWFLLTLFFCKL